MQADRMFTTRKLVILAMISAIAFILTTPPFRFPLVPAVSFLRFDAKDVVIVIGGFMFGPVAALVVVIVVALVQMFTISDTGIIGFLMNVISGVAFCGTASLIYSKWRTMRGAVFGLITAVLLTTCVMLMWNYLVTPWFMGVSREVVVRMLIPGFLPFNLINYSINAALILLIYKSVRAAMIAARIMPQPEDNEKMRLFSPISLVVGGFLLLTCVLWVAALQGWI